MLFRSPGTPAEKAAIELYDYQTDPLERKNLATDRPEVVSELRAILAQVPEAKPQQSDEGSPESGYEKKPKKKRKDKGDGE